MHPQRNGLYTRYAKAPRGENKVLNTISEKRLYNIKQDFESIIFSTDFTYKFEYNLKKYEIWKVFRNFAYKFELKMYKNFT